ncbi:MAG: leucyl aminopeptidase family protein [Synechococcales bacterium]|nr:leucyl aminopeptidase family protein [Synechococcales bacterium]
MAASTPIYLVTPDAVKQLPEPEQLWLQVSRFKGEAGSACLVPSVEGGLAKVLVGQSDPLDTWLLGSLAQSLPPGHYHLASDVSAEVATRLCLGWRLGQYQFKKYKDTKDSPLPELGCPAAADQAYVEAATAATYLVRDLVNTPAGDMGPAQLEKAVQAIAHQHQATFQAIVGEELLAQNYPMVHAVGRASIQPPRLLDLRWGHADQPKVTLVGKGVCFDTGGLDIKSASNMKLMKKDMGGAAQVLGLASMIMAMQLPVCLRVLVPAVENSISDNAVHPYDVLPSRKGISVEVGNTDAEGRLVLADALWEAASEQPDLLVDCATLTGAARIALGTELPAFFCNQPEVAIALRQSGLAVDDPLWELPLHNPYRDMLDSKVADICNISSGSYGGAITAALFLREFIQPEIPWIHIDLMAWNLRSLPGRPEGGEAMGMRALFELIRNRFAQSS